MVSLLSMFALEALSSGSLVAAVGERGPEPEDVKAGWTAFALFGLLVATIVVLGFSLTKRLKNAARAEEAGLYDPSDKAPRIQIGTAEAGEDDDDR